MSTIRLRASSATGDVGVGGDLTGDDDEAGRHERLDRDPAVRVLGEQRVEHRVADLVGDLVGMTLGHGLGREQSTCQEILLERALPAAPVGLVKGNGRSQRTETTHRRRPATAARPGPRSRRRERLRTGRYGDIRPVRAERITAGVSSEPKTAPAPTSLATSRSQPLRSSLARAWSSTLPRVVAGLGGEADQHLPVAAPRRLATRAARMSGFSTRSTVGVAPSGRFLILCSTERAGRKSAGAAAITTASAVSAAASTASYSSSVDTTRTTVAPAGSGSSTFAATTVTSAPRAAAVARQRVALLARGPVAEEAHRVEVLAGPTGGDDDAPAGQVGSPRRRARARDGDGEDRRRARGAGRARCRRR